DVGGRLDRRLTVVQRVPEARDQPGLKHWLKAPPDERGGNRHAQPNVTAPHFDSTDSSRPECAKSDHSTTLGSVGLEPRSERLVWASRVWPTTCRTGRARSER